MRVNGLRASSFVPVVDVDPRVADQLLDLLRLADVAAYSEPAPGRTGVYRDHQVPTRRLDRLWVDRTETARARSVLDHAVPHLQAELEVAIRDGFPLGVDSRVAMSGDTSWNDHSDRTIGAGMDDRRGTPGLSSTAVAETAGHDGAPEQVVGTAGRSGAEPVALDAPDADTFPGTGSTGAGPGPDGIGANGTAPDGTGSGDGFRGDVVGSAQELPAETPVDISPVSRVLPPAGGVGPALDRAADPRSGGSPVSGPTGLPSDEMDADTPRLQPGVGVPVAAAGDVGPPAGPVIVPARAGQSDPVPDPAGGARAGGAHAGGAHAGGRAAAAGEFDDAAVEAAWAAIVADFDSTPDGQAPWPAAEDVFPPRAPRLRRPVKATPQSGRAVEREADSDHFVPPPPPAMPRLDPMTRIGWAALVAGPILLVLVVVFNHALPGWVPLLGVFTLVGGFALLVSRLRPNDSDEDDTDHHDGAVV